MTRAAVIRLPFASPWSGKLTLRRTQRSGNVFKEMQLGAEMRQSFDQMNISDAAVSVCEMRAIKSEDSDPRSLPSASAEREPRRSSQTSAAHSLFIRQPLPPPRIGQLRPRLLRPLSDSFDAALVAFWCLYPHRGASNRAFMERTGIRTACLWGWGGGGGGEFFLKKNINMFNSCFIWESVDWATV